MNISRPALAGLLLAALFFAQDIGPKLAGEVKA